MHGTSAESHHVTYTTGDTRGRLSLHPRTNQHPTESHLTGNQTHSFTTTFIQPAPTTTTQTHSTATDPKQIQIELLSL